MFPGEPQDMPPDGNLVVPIGVHRGYRLDRGGQEVLVREADHDIAGPQILDGDRAGRREDGRSLFQAAPSSAAKGRRRDESRQQQCSQGGCDRQVMGTSARGARHGRVVNEPQTASRR